MNCILALTALICLYPIDTYNRLEVVYIQALRCTTADYRIVSQAAERNNCFGDNFIILLSIWQSENGGAGREFGVLHPRAIDTNLDTQAGWAAATVQKNRQRWIDSGRQGEYIDFLANRYCPAESDPVGNVNWKRNVQFWVNKLKEVKI